MPYHVAIAGKKTGPYPGYRVIDLLREGAISPDDLAWEPGMAEWMKLREFAAFAETAVEVDHAKRSTPDSSEDGDEDEDEDEDEEGDEGEDDKAGAEPGKAGDARGDEKGRAKVTIRFSASPRRPKAVPEGGAEQGSGDPPEEGGKQKARSGGSDGQGALPGMFPGRPFARAWARAFDYLLASTVAWQFCEVPQIPPEATPWDLLKNDGTLVDRDAFLRMAWIHYAALMLWHVLEGVLLHVRGTTPGKALFGIRVATTSGDRLPLGLGLGRSFYVWFAGFGLGLFPFNLIGMTLGFFMLVFGGATLWDRQARTRVLHAPLGPGRILLAAGCFLLLMVLSSHKFS